MNPSPGTTVEEVVYGIGEQDRSHGKQHSVKDSVIAAATVLVPGRRKIYDRNHADEQHIREGLQGDIQLYLCVHAYLYHISTF